MNKRVILASLILLLINTAFLAAQSGGGVGVGETGGVNDSGEPVYTRRFIWRGGANSLRFNIEIERQEGTEYNHYISEYTELHFIDIDLPAGNYRFRIIPHDALDRPAEGTRWYNATISPPPVQTAGSDSAAEEQLNVIDISGGGAEYIAETVQEPETAAVPVVVTPPAVTENQNERVAEEKPAKNNSFDEFTAFYIGVDFISTFIIGGYAAKSILGNFFFGGGFDFGFFLTNTEEGYLSNYPYLNFGLFFPISNHKFCILFGAGVGYQYNIYSNDDDDYFSLSDEGFTANFTVGIKLLKSFYISYMVRTNFNFDFASAIHKLGIGYGSYTYW